MAFKSDNGAGATANYNMNDKTGNVQGTYSGNGASASVNSDGTGTIKLKEKNFDVEASSNKDKSNFGVNIYPSKDQSVNANIDNKGGANIKIEDKTGWGAKVSSSFLLIYLLYCALAHAIQKPDSQYYPPYLW
jgi:hypothetical protein